MSRVFLCLTAQHDGRLLLLAVLVCMLASLSVINMFHRARALTGALRFAWVVGAGIASGCGVWATHFIAELAYSPGFAISFDVFFTAVSLAIAIVLSIAGIAIAIYVPHRLSAAIGGAVLGTGIVCMHYSGIHALQIAGSIFWATDLVVTSIVFAVLFGAFALEIASRGDQTRLLVAAASMLALSIVSLHFVGMAAVGIIPNPLTLISPSTLSPPVLSFVIAMVVGSLMVIGLSAAMSDRHTRREIRARNKLLDAALNNMNQGLCMFDAQNRLLVWNERYCRMYKIAPWTGCTIRELLEARIAAGTFPLNVDRYENDLIATLRQGKTFTNNIELPDGRMIAVVNQPIGGGGWVATHEDVTERRRAEAELGRTRSFLDTIIKSVPMPIIVKSIPDLRYVLINNAAEKFFGIPTEGIIGKTAHDVWGQDIARAVAAQDHELIRTAHEIYYDEHELVTGSGDTRIVTSTRLPIMGADDKPQYLITVIHDVTQQKQDKAKISYLAHHDPHTDLPNRNAFNESLNVTLEAAAKSGEHFALMSLDLDRFKGVNDVFGHSVGDGLLLQVARRLEAACEGAFLARTGGDEFAVVVKSGPQPATAEATAERIVETIGSEFVIGAHRLAIGATVGISVYPSDGTDASALIANADAALYRAKTDARGSIKFFEPDMDKELRERRALAHDLRSAIANEELELFYQPVANAEGAIIGFEALARWHHPRRGMVRPDIFIPLAEESGLIDMLGEWVLRTACREAASWPNQLRIAVNLSPVQFRHDDLVAQVHTILLETGLPARRLTVEVTEGVLVHDFSRALSILRRLKTLGVRVAMDDFGTGYSSLSYLQAFSFDTIKIDRSFVANVCTKPQSAAIVKAVISLAHGLGLAVVGEGVETEEQRVFLREASCDRMQGYLIGRPHPIERYAGAVGRVTAKSIAAAG
jgi:diguanylate cyclase (GGDEF)-like protein/PAS domain S-box-containing protein